MRFLLQPAGEDAERPVEAARAAHAAGLDGVLLAPSEELPAPLVTAAYVAASVPDVLIAAEVPIGDRHPVEVAEEALVADQASGGRLILVARPAPGAEDAYAEALDLVRVATVARPFRFAGERWTVPARLPENSDAHDDLLRVTPPPARARLELWCSGVPVAVAAEHDLGHVAEAQPANGTVAAAAERAPVERIAERGTRSAAGTDARIAADDGPRSGTTGAAFESGVLVDRRARRDRWIGAGALVERLRAGRVEIGQDWSVVVAPIAAAAEIGGEVRPRVQLDRLPEGLEQHWASA